MSQEKALIGIDLFAGAGGMSLGFEQAGIHACLAIEQDPIHSQVYKSNFEQTQVVCSDIKLLGSRKINSFLNTETHVIFGGPPCQGFSLMGHRKIDDPRNELVFEFVRMLRIVRPLYFVMENVPGILFGSAVKVVERFVEQVEKLGYSIVLPIQILNAKDYGVPQDRARVMILGYKNGLRAPKYPKPHKQNISYVTVSEAINDLPSVDLYPYLIDSDVYRGILGQPSRYATALRTDLQRRRGTSLRASDMLTGCMRTVHSKEVTERFRMTRQGEQEKISHYHRLSNDGQAPTIRAGTGPDKGSFMAARPIHPVEPRCITVREAARLHSFPDSFQFHPTKWHSFRQIGNSVPPYLAKAVASEIMNALMK